MSTQREVPRLEDDRTTLDGLAPRTAWIAGAVGLLALAGALAVGAAQNDGLRHFGYSYLVNFAFFLSLSLGALFFKSDGGSR